MLGRRPSEKIRQEREGTSDAWQTRFRKLQGEEFGKLAAAKASPKQLAELRRKQEGLRKRLWKLEKAKINAPVCTVWSLDTLPGAPTLTPPSLPLPLCALTHPRVHVRSPHQGVVAARRRRAASPLPLVRSTVA